MKRDPLGEIERAARKAGERAKRNAPRVESADDRKRRQLRQARDLLRESLTGSPSVGFLNVLEAGGYFLLPFVVVLGFTHWDLDSPPVIALLVVSSAASIFLGLTLRARVMAAVRTARIRRVGHGFDAARYLAQLSERRPDARLVVELGFLRPVDQQLQQLATELVGRRCREVRAEWKHGALKLESQALAGTGSVNDEGSVTRFFTNRPVHDCFTQIVHGVVPALPVSRLKVEITGKTVSFDQSAGS